VYVVANASNESPPLTATGTALRVSVPSPSLPSTFAPQHIAAFVIVIAQGPPKFPVEIELKVATPDIGVGTATLSMLP
jgi:hypothetical protein